jgi:copper oxidase (laccase) domain-containing protein
VNPQFELVELNGHELLVYLPWWRKGICHGQTTRSFSFRAADIRESSVALCACIGASYLALPLQSHGAELVDLSNGSVIEAALKRDGDLLRHLSGDAILTPAGQPLESTVIAYGIMTADCVPIIVASDDGYLLIHAGWRGLANGIICETIRTLGRPREVVIFAAAGGERYEVGVDVVNQIGPAAVCVSVNGSTDKYLLDTAATAAKQIESNFTGLNVERSMRCTITDLRFHSYRRDGASAGRCVTFVVP